MANAELQTLSRILGTGDVQASVVQAGVAKKSLMADMARKRSRAAALAGQRASAKGANLTSINNELVNIVADTKDLKDKLGGVETLIEKFSPLAEMEFGGNGLVFAPPQAGQYVRIPMYAGGVSTTPAITLTDGGTATGTLQTLEVSWLDVMAVGIEFGRQDGVGGASASVAFSDPKVSGGATLLTSDGFTPVNAYRMEDNELAGIRHYARVPKHSHIETNVRIEDHILESGAISTIFASVIAHIIFDNNFGKLNSPDVRSAFKRALGDVFKIGAGGFVFSPSAPPPGQLERLPMYVETADAMNTALDNPCVWFAAAGGTLGASVFTKTMINDQNSIESDFQIVGIEFGKNYSGGGAADEVVCTQDFKVANGPGLFPHENWTPTLNYLGDEGGGRRSGGKASRGGLRFYPVLEKNSEVRVDVGVFDTSSGNMATADLEGDPTMVEASLLVHRLTDPVLGHKYGLSAHGLLLRAAQACGCSF